MFDVIGVEGRGLNQVTGRRDDRHRIATPGKSVNAVGVTDQGIIVRQKVAGFSFVKKMPLDDVTGVVALDSQSRGLNRTVVKVSRSTAEDRACCSTGEDSIRDGPIDSIDIRSGCHTED